MPNAAASSYQAFDADVSAAGDSRHIEYLDAVVDQEAAAVEKIQVQIEGLKETLAEKKACLASARKALKAAKES